MHVSKLWGGRFTKPTDKLVEEFTASIGFDQKLAVDDIRGSLAHVKMLGACGIIPQEDADTIHDGLLSILADAKAGKLTYSVENEDIHMNIEKHLIERIGPVGGKLHTGRSRNDQVATDMHLYLRRETKQILALLADVLQALLETAEKYEDVIIPGYTHLQRAQPVLFAHHLLAYVGMFTRDVERLQDALKRIDILPLGAGALAGTTFPIDRQMVAAELGFSRIYENSMDAVSDRDFILEFLSDASILMMHLSRFSEELVIWSSTEFGFVELDDAYTTGSSIMPQKKNPDVAELIRGKSGRVFGNLFGLLTVLKGLPLAYNKDLQEDKEGSRRCFCKNHAQRLPQQRLVHLALFLFFLESLRQRKDILQFIRRHIAKIQKVPTLHVFDLPFFNDRHCFCHSYFLPQFMILLTPAQPVPTVSVITARFVPTPLPTRTRYPAMSDKESSFPRWNVSAKTQTDRHPARVSVR